jgi:hypothetical protein
LKTSGLGLFARKLGTGVLDPVLCLSSQKIFFGPINSFAVLSLAVVLQVFEELLLDADWALNAGNWMWLSASAFFHQYFRLDPGI